MYSSNKAEMSAKETYYQAQRYLLDDVENKHDQAPDKPALIFAGGLSVVEAGVAFYILFPAGGLIATIGALFPVFLLWAMANYQAERVELSKKCDELAERYDNDSI